MTSADPPESNEPERPSDSELAGIDPAKLMAEVQKPISSATGTSPGGWEPPLPDELADLMPGYKIVDVLGRGGMGAVYRGVQKSLDREVAIKLLPPELGADPEFETRFRREAKAMAKLNHANIVSIFDFGQTAEGHHYFVMEYVDGTDLHQLIRSGQLDAEGALNAVSQICDALEYAHEEGFVHRDIKPANIFINSKGMLKVGDFGLAKLVDVDGDEAVSAMEQLGLTQTGVAMGTPHYIAPEQMVEGSSVDRRADIYSLGVMFYEMLTGEIPRGAVRPPSQKVAAQDKSIDVRLDDVVFKAMESDPDERYQSATDLRTDVDGIRMTPGGGAAQEEGEAIPVARLVEEEGPRGANALKVRERKGGRSKPENGRKGSSGSESSREKKSPVLIAAMIGVPLLLIGGVLAVAFNDGNSTDDGGERPGTVGIDPVSAPAGQASSSSNSAEDDDSQLTQWLQDEPVYEPFQGEDVDRDIRITTEHLLFLDAAGSEVGRYRIERTGPRSVAYVYSSTGKQVDVTFSDDFREVTRSEKGAVYRLKILSPDLSTIGTTDPQNGAADQAATFDPELVKGVQWDPAAENPGAAKWDYLRIWNGRIQFFDLSGASHGYDYVPVSNTEIRWNWSDGTGANGVFSDDFSTFSFGEQGQWTRGAELDSAAGTSLTAIPQGGAEPVLMPELEGDPSSALPSAPRFAGRLRGLLLDPDSNQVVPLPVPEEWKEKKVRSIGAHNYGGIRWWAIAVDGEVLRFDGANRLTDDFESGISATVLDWERFEAWIKLDGSLGASSRIQPVPDGTDFIDVEVGNSFALALRRDGTVAHWFETGREGEQFRPEPSTFVDVAAIEASGTTGAVLKKSGEVIWWDQKEGLKPVAIAETTRAVALSGNHDSVMVRNADGTVQFPGGRPWEGIPEATVLRYGHSLSAIRSMDRQWHFRSVHGEDDRQRLKGFQDTAEAENLSAAIDVQVAADTAKGRGVLLWIEPSAVELDPRILGKEWSLLDDSGDGSGTTTLILTSEEVIWRGKVDEWKLPYSAVAENEVFMPWGTADRGISFDVDAGTMVVWHVDSPEKTRIAGRLAADSGDADPVAKRLAQIDAQFELRYAAEVGATHEAAVDRLGGQIIAALKRAQEAATTGGDLDAVLQCRRAVERLESGRGVPTTEEIAAEEPPVDRPEQLLGFYATYRAELAKLEAARDEQTKPFIAMWDRAMDLYQQELTRENQIEAALRVKAARDDGPSALGRDYSEMLAPRETTTPSADSMPDTAAPSASAPDLLAANKARYQIDYSRSGALKVAGTIGRDGAELPVPQPSGEEAKGVSFVAVGYETGGRWLAVKQDGSVVSPMKDSWEVPRSVKRPRWVDLGTQGLAVAEDGELIIWGEQKWRPDKTLRNVVKAESSHDNSIALHEDGTVSVWGPMYGDFEPEKEWLADAVDVAAGSVRAWVLKSDGTIIGWNSDGNLADQNPQSTPKIGSAGEVGYTQLRDIVCISGSHRNLIGLTREGLLANNQGVDGNGWGPLQAVVSGYMVNLGLSREGRILVDNIDQKSRRFAEAFADFPGDRKVIAVGTAGDGTDPKFHGFVAWIEED